jgi:hypothetical protein
MSARQRVTPPSRSRAAAAPSLEAHAPLPPLSPLPPKARALWIALALLWAMRAIAMLAPGRYLWGLDVGRDTPAAFAWTLWALGALALIPAIARAAAAALRRKPRGTLIRALVLALAAAAFLWAHPDRVRFTGDADIRGAAMLDVARPESLIPQAMPGDLFLHVRAPIALHAHGVKPPLYARSLGALLAALSMLVAWRLARVLDVRGATALAVIVTAACTAALALYGGYAKGSVELVLITMAAGVSAVAIAREREGLLPLALLTSAGIIMHRAGLLLLPLYVAALVSEVARRRTAALARWDFWAALAAPVATLVWLGPSLLHIVSGFDATHHVAQGQGGVLAYALRPSHLRDVANLCVLLVPVAPALLVLAVRARERGAREGVLLASALVPALAVLLFLRPQQGLFRDWDVFAGTGALLAVTLAVYASDLFERERAAAWLAVPLLFMSAVPALQWVSIQHDEPRGLERAWQQLQGPPAAEDEARARGFSSLGMHYYGSDWTRFADACSLSIASAPNPSVYVQWGMAKTMLAQYAPAQQAYLHAAQLNPQLVLAWRGVAASSSALGDLPHMQQAVDHLRVLDPNGPTTRDAMEYLAQQSKRGH